MSEQDHRQPEPATRVEKFKQTIELVISQEIKRHVIKAREELQQTIAAVTEENATLKAEISRLESEKLVQVKSITEYHKQIDDFRELLDRKEKEIERLNEHFGQNGPIKEEEMIKPEPEVQLNTDDTSVYPNFSYSFLRRLLREPSYETIELSD